MGSWRVGDDGRWPSGFGCVRVVAVGEPGEPLIPLRLFADRNFSLAGVGIASMSFCVISTGLPMMFYTQLALGFSPTKAALTQAPTAIVSGILAPLAGWLVDRVRPSILIGGGIALMIASTLWWTLLMRPETQMWQLMLPAAGIGAAMACIWGPLATTATRNLPPSVAGAGSGVYNTLRQVGGVVGSSAMGALMTARLTATMPAMPPGSGSTPEGALPPGLRAPFSAAMAQSMLLGIAALALGLVAALFMRPGGSQVGAVPLDDVVSVED